MTNQSKETIDEKFDENIEQDVTNEEVKEAANEEASAEPNADNSVIVQLEKQLEETQQKLLRVQADYDNFRRRTVKEKEDLAKYASAKLIENILPTVDNFDRAIAVSAENKDYDSFAKGVDMIFRQLMSTMENEGLTAMNAVGQPFNPEYHQAIMSVESDEYEEGYVVEEIQKGYMIKDRVVRPAMVKVSQ